MDLADATLNRTHCGFPNGERLGFCLYAIAGLSALAALAASSTAAFAQSTPVTVVSQQYRAYGSVDWWWTPECPEPRSYDTSTTQPVSGHVESTCAYTISATSSASCTFSQNSFTCSVSQSSNSPYGGSGESDAGASLSVRFSPVVRSQCRVRPGAVSPSRYASLAAAIRDVTTGTTWDLVVPHWCYDSPQWSVTNLQMPLEPSHTYEVAMSTDNYEAGSSSSVILTFEVASIDSGRTPLTHFVDAASPNDPGSGTQADPYRRIQDALASAHTIDGDTVVVAPGLYFENLMFCGKAITLIGGASYDANYAGPSIIDGSRPQSSQFGSVVEFLGSEDSRSRLVGLILRGGSGRAVGWYYDTAGGAVYGNNASPSLNNCIIVGNSAFYGAACFECNGSITNCTLAANASGAALENCRGTIANCILWDTYGFLPGCSLPHYSCIQQWTGGGQGNITTDPLFADPDNDNYHLAPGSPCINAGDPAFLPQLSEPDIDGEPRVMQGRVDMGADESPCSSAVPYVTNLATGITYCTIQSAIDAANDGDEVVLCPGTYRGNGNRNLDFRGKAITLRSSSPEDSAVVAATVIDCEEVGRGFHFHNSEGSSSVLKGLTITAGLADRGGGILCDHASPTIEDCVITGNKTFNGSPGTESIPDGGSAGPGGGICFIASQSRVRRCRFIANATGRGGDATSQGDVATAGGVGGDGGGVYAGEGSEIGFISCIVTDNRTGGGGWAYDAVAGSSGGRGGAGAGVCAIESSLEIRDTDIEHNRCGSGGSVQSESWWVLNAASGSGGDGGGVCVEGSGTLLLLDSTVSANHAGAGGVSEIGKTGEGGSGGGILARGCSANIHNCSISWNTSGSGGIGQCGLGSDGGSGGGVCCLAVGLVVIANSAILNNASGSGGGGLLDCGGGGSGGSGGNGGGVFCSSLTTPVFEACTIEGNLTGGGLSSDGGPGSGGNGGGVYCTTSPQLLQCTIRGNRTGWGGTDWLHGGAGSGGDGGGIYVKSADITGCSIVGNTCGATPPTFGEPERATGRAAYTFGLGAFRMRNSSADGISGIMSADSSILLTSTDHVRVDKQLRLSDTATITGDGTFTVEETAAVQLEGSTTIDLTCGSAACEPGRFVVDGLLHAKDNARVQNARITVTRARFEGRVSLDNNVITAEAGLPVGQFYIEGTASVTNNYIYADGDRYLDLDPSLFNGSVLNNHLFVTITEGVGLTRGGLLECRGQDLDCDSGSGEVCHSGHHEKTARPFSQTTWTLDRLELVGDSESGAKLNLTNRFRFQPPFAADPGEDDGGPEEVVYVKDLVLGDNTQLNTGLQRLYYQNLQAASSSEIVDIPLLGFSLGIIAMEDDQEFYRLPRVDRRTKDPIDEQPCTCYGNCPDNNPPRDARTCLEGLVERLDRINLQAEIRELDTGVMDMRTRAHERAAASSVAAKGTFAKASENEIVIAFEYLFRQTTAGSRINVYLSDRPTHGERIFKVAELRPPEPTSAGGTDSKQFALFSGRFPRLIPGVNPPLSFVRGTFVELELVANEESPGHRMPGEARVWIDNFDPQVHCQTHCATFDNDSEPTLFDLLILLAETGQAVPLGKYCLDLSDDGYVNLGDVATWNVIAKLQDYSLCPQRRTGACCMPDGTCVEDTREACEATGGKWHKETCTQVTCAAPTALLESTRASTDKPLRPTVIALNQPATDQLVILGTPGAISRQDDRIYTSSAGGTCKTNGQPVKYPAKDWTQGATRLVRDANQTLYVVHSIEGVLEVETGQYCVKPQLCAAPPQLPSGAVVRVGVDAASKEGVPLADAAFDPWDTGPATVFVVPVEVTVPQLENVPQHKYKAAAQLSLLENGNVSVVTIYGHDPYSLATQRLPGNECLTCTPMVEGATCRPSCDFSGMREIEVDTDGKVYVAGGVYNVATGGTNANDWLQVFDPSGLEVGRVNLDTAFAMGAIPVPKSPVAMLLSSVDPTVLYLTSQFDLGRDLITRVYRYNTTGGIPFVAWDGVVEVEHPMPEARSGTTCDGFASNITAIQEAPDGRLYVVGYSAPTFERDEVLPESVRGIFTTPSVAEIPFGTAWSRLPANVVRVPAHHIMGCHSDLALPLSALFISAADGVVDRDDDGIPDGQDLCPDTPSCVVVDASGCPLVDCSSIAGFEAVLVSDTQIEVTVRSTLPNGTMLNVVSDDERHFTVDVDDTGIGRVLVERRELAQTLSLVECPRSATVNNGEETACWQITKFEAICDESDPATPKVVSKVESILPKGIPLTLRRGGEEKVVTTDCRGEAMAEFYNPTGGQTVTIVQCQLSAPTIGCPTGSPVDFNFDGHVDEQDFEVFRDCALGPELGLSSVPACGPADVDSDGDVDSADFAVFQRCWSGNWLADPACGR